MRVYIDIPGLNRAASQERLWPSRVGRCEGPPPSYVRMPFGLPSVASTYQRNMRRVLAAQEARYHAVLEEMEMVFREPPETPEPPESTSSSATPTLLRLQNQVTSSKLV